MLPVDTLVDKGGETRIGRQGVLKVIGSVTRGRGARAHDVGTSLPSKSSSWSTGRFAQAMRVNTHYAQSATRRGSARARTSPATRPQSFCLGRRKRRLAGCGPVSCTRASRTRRNASAAASDFSFPHRQVGAGVDDGERAIANVRFQPTKLRLGHSQGDQHDAIGLLQIWAKLFKSSGASRRRHPRTIFQQLTIVITYVAGHVI